MRPGLCTLPVLAPTLPARLSAKAPVVDHHLRGSSTRASQRADFATEHQGALLNRFRS